MTQEWSFHLPRNRGSLVNMFWIVRVRLCTLISETPSRRKINMMDIQVRRKFDEYEFPKGSRVEGMPVSPANAVSSGLTDYEAFGMR